ncbi:hypothetical protein C7271_15815 [filamentous cyanobacterium CCP5]|nr:hypothetical protein C7271_15815 [filamentous cyanobacterium CCP5]
MSKNRAGRCFAGLIRPALKPLVYGAVAIISTLGVTLPLAAATTPSEPTITTPVLPGNTVIQLAQTAGNTILNIEYPRAYTVRVFDVGNGQLRTNVFQRIDDVLEGSAAPTTFRGYSDGFARYVATYVYNGQQRQADIRYNPTTREARLVIFNETRNAADFEETRAQRILTAQNLPPTTPTPGQPTPTPELATALAFDTTDYAVRVFTDNNARRLMRVFSKQSGQLLLQDQPVEVLSAVPPNANAVRYSAIGTFNNAPAQYVARVEPGSTNAQLTIIGLNNGQVFSNQTGNATTVQIPSVDRPGVIGGGTPTTPAEQLNPYVAAVFGNENTLAQIRQQAVPTAQFEDARLGRFINAGSFQSRDQAESLVSYLRSLGFNSRLVFRDVDYR